MNLKVFHLVFIGASILLAAGFGVWCLRSWSAAGGAGLLAGGIASFAAAAGLVAYGIWFIGKARRL